MGDAARRAPRLGAEAVWAPEAVGDAPFNFLEAAELNAYQM